MLCMNSSLFDVLHFQCEIQLCVEMFLLVSKESPSERHRPTFSSKYICKYLTTLYVPGSMLQMSNIFAPQKMSFILYHEHSNVNRDHFHRFNEDLSENKDVYNAYFVYFGRYSFTHTTCAYLHVTLYPRALRNEMWNAYKSLR